MNIEARPYLTPRQRHYLARLRMTAAKVPVRSAGRLIRTGLVRKLEDRAGVGLVWCEITDSGLALLDGEAANDA